MTARILDGRECSEKIQSRVKTLIAERTQKGLMTPGLSVILVGNNEASLTYVRNKQLSCEKVGIRSTLQHLPESVTRDQLAELIHECNQDSRIHGILLQLPLPNHLQSQDFLERIDFRKDVDGFHPYNLGRLVQRRPFLRPCTPYGIITLLKETGISLSGKHAVVVGASNIVGRPMALELLLEKCTVTICHAFTQDLEKHVRQADVLISAIGKPDVIQSNWLSENAIVIDVGFNRLPHGKIIGDIDFETAKEKVAWITPVPGGVGPMTIATLLQNTLKAAESQQDFH